MTMPQPNLGTNKDQSVSQSTIRLLGSFKYLQQTTVTQTLCVTGVRKI